MRQSIPIEYIINYWVPAFDSNSEPPATKPVEENIYLFKTKTQQQQRNKTTK